MKRCPFCAEEIQDEAVLCRWCGRDLSPPSTPTRTVTNRPKEALLPAAIFTLIFATIGLFANAPSQPSPLPDPRCTPILSLQERKVILDTVFGEGSEGDVRRIATAAAFARQDRERCREAAEAPPPPRSPLVAPDPISVLLGAPVTFFFFWILSILSSAVSERLSIQGGRWWGPLGCFLLVVAGALAAVLAAIGAA